MQRDHASAVRFYQTPKNAYKTKEFYAAEENSSWQLFDSECSSIWVDAPDATSLRYLWSNYAKGNLFGKNGLPAAPFAAEITVSTS